MNNIRAIESKSDIEKRKRRNQWIIGGILLVIMFGSTFGYAISSFNNDNTGNNKINYKGYEFIGENGFWTTTIGSYDFMFKYNPTEVERIEIGGDGLRYLSSYSGLPLYLFTEDSGAQVEINRNMANVILRFQGACPEKMNCTQDWPVKDCSNNFIIIREANESRIYQNESCVFIEGPQGNLTQLADEFLFWTTGIES
jgi:hypothetical protein